MSTKKTIKRSISISLPVSVEIVMEIDAETGEFDVTSAQRSSIQSNISVQDLFESNEGPDLLSEVADESYEEMKARESDPAASQEVATKEWVHFQSKSSDGKQSYPHERFETGLKPGEYIHPYSSKGWWAHESGAVVKGRVDDNDKLVAPSLEDD